MAATMTTAGKSGGFARMLSGGRSAWLMALLLVPVLACADFDRGVAAFDRGDYLAALQEFSDAAKRDDVHAQNFLGMMYADGLGTARDDRRAADWFARAAILGYPDAQANLALMYALGRAARPGAPARRTAARAAPRPAIAAKAGSGEVGAVLAAPDAVRARAWRTRAQNTEIEIAESPLVFGRGVEAATVEPVVKPAVKPAVTPAVKRDQPRFQLGAFVLRKNAEMLREIALTRLGLPPDAVRISEGGGLFRVQVGPYADRDESRRMLQKIKSGLGIDAFAVR